MTGVQHHVDEWKRRLTGHQLRGLAVGVLGLVLAAIVVWVAARRQRPESPPANPGR